MNIEEIKQQYLEAPLGRAKDLSQLKFGKLQPLYRTNLVNKKAVF